MEASATGAFFFAQIFQGRKINYSAGDGNGFGSVSDWRICMVRSDIWNFVHNAYAERAGSQENTLDD